ncbi:glycosyltransferase family 4 protein [Patescibacteria group bacterium]|nr:glycosyltransferase family 4 protein [Patescibacteria group bacterium]
MMYKKVLYVTTIDITVWSFLLPSLIALRKEGYEVEVACGGGKFFKDIQNEGFKVYFVPFNRKFYHWSNIKALFRILKILRRNQYDILHTHTPVASFISRIAAKIAKVPIIIYTVHGFHFYEHGNELANICFYFLEKLAGRCTDIFITINTDDYRKAKKMFSNNRTFYVKGVGINTQEFMPENINSEKLADLRDELRINNNEEIIGIVAEMNPGKRHIDFLRAANLISRKKNNVKFLIIGTGRLMDYYKNVTKKLSIDKDCIFTGFRRDILELLSLMDIFVFPSAREGLPVSLMEAMSMRKPAVVANIRGNRDLVIDGITGKIVPVKNSQAIADAVLEMLNNPEKRKKMGEEARRRIESEFEEKIVLEQILKIYREC